METINLQFKSMVEEPVNPVNGCCRYSHSAFTHKIPKWLTPCDFDDKEKLVEVEFKDGNRAWIPIKTLFGKVIEEAKEIFIVYENKDVAPEPIEVASIATQKIKRTMYWRLIFETDLPF